MVDIVYLVVSGDTDPDSEFGSDRPFDMADVSAFAFAKYEDARAFAETKVTDQGVDAVVIGSPVILSW